MKNTFLIIFLITCFLSVNAQQFSLSVESGIFLSPETDELKSDTSFMITQSDFQTIDIGTSVSCNTNGVHYENSYYRVFDLVNDFNLNGDWSVQAVEVGIGFAESGTGTTQPALLRLWTMSVYNEISINTDSLTFKPDSIFFEINNNESGTIKNIIIEPAISIPHGNVLVVEVLVPYIENAKHKFFIGSNDLGEQDNTYIKAADCGIDDPVDVEEIGYADMHLVLNVIGAYDAATPEILSFSIDGQLDGIVINEPDYLINVIMPADTLLDALAPDISVPLGFYISPESTEIIDFSLGPVEYTVTNEYSKISQSWLVNVLNAGPEIIDVQIPIQNDETIIDTDNFTATVYVPFGTNLTDLSPVISLYDGFTINPESGESQDFSLGAISYTVSHETLSLSQDWDISVEESAGADIRDNENSIFIYPNPAYDFIIVSGSDIINIELLNSLGILVSSSINKSINTTNLPGGIYFLKIQTSSGTMLKKVLVLKK